MITNYQLRIYDKISAKWYIVGNFIFPIEFNVSEDIALTAACELGLDMSEFEVRKNRKPYYRKSYV